MGERGLRPPGQVARAGDHRLRQAFANFQEVIEPFCDPSLCDPQPSTGDAKTCGRDESGLCFAIPRRERLLCLIELALLEENPDEHAEVDDAVDRRCPEPRRRPGRPGVSLWRLEGPPPEPQPPPVRPAEGQPGPLRPWPRPRRRG